MRAVELIAAKRDGRELPADALHDFVLAYARDEVPDYQMAAFLMAGYLNGFSRDEAVALTHAMVESGDRLDLSRLSGPTVDKHSTGGVGDGTTLVVAPLAAELGMQVVKLSGHGLGHTGGTLDKLDAIPGMRTELSSDELVSQVEEIGLAVCAQTADLVPADKAMYGLRRDCHGGRHRADRLERNEQEAGRWGGRDPAGREDRLGRLHGGARRRPGARGAVCGAG